MPNLSKPIDRSKVNERSASMQDMPKSGFDLSYNSYRDYILGRIHVGGYHHIMPADKFSGSNEGDHTFNNLVTPMMSPVDCCQHNFFVTLRSIDNTFEDAFAPSALNGMSASWSAPTFKLSDVVTDLLYNIPYLTNTRISTFFDAAFGKWTTSQQVNPDATELNKLISLFDSTISWLVGQNRPIDDNLFIRDIMYDIRTNVSNMKSILFPSGLSSIRYDDVLRAWCRCFLYPFIGENSLLDSLGYNYLRASDVEYIVSHIATSTAGGVTYKSLESLVDNIPQNEYALRAYYAVWYEYFRDYNLEPVNSTLPKWKDFGSTSVVAYNASLNYGPFFLLTRVRSWYKDPYISSMPDDIMRHVFAPIYNGASTTVYRDSATNDIEYAESTANQTINIHNIDAYDLSYKDVITGSLRTVKVPIPKRVNDSISTNGSSLSVFYLDLLSLRNAQALERYLKRNFYGGDEYKDRMLSHYGSVISDYSVKRPILLSSSVSNVELKQEIAPVNTPTTNVGDRTATATCTSGGDGYEFFAEEFGIVLNLIQFMPRAQYAGICPQNLQVHQVDYPIPEFAANNEEFSRILEVGTSGLRKSQTFQLGTFGHHPYAHAYRGRIDEVHGSFLSDRQSYTFRRFFGLDNSDGSPKLNYWFIHCHPNLSMFMNTNLFDCQLYGRDTHNFFVERVLPTPIEII